MLLLLLMMIMMLTKMALMPSASCPPLFGCTIARSVPARLVLIRNTLHPYPITKVRCCYSSVLLLLLFVLFLFELNAWILKLSRYNTRILKNDISVRDDENEDGARHECKYPNQHIIKYTTGIFLLLQTPQTLQHSTTQQRQQHNVNSRVPPKVCFP